MKKANEFISKIKQEVVIESPNIKVELCRDPKDSMFLELAKFVKADYIITGDKDLHNLKIFENTKILKPN